MKAGDRSLCRLLSPLWSGRHFPRTCCPAWGLKSEWKGREVSLLFMGSFVFHQEAKYRNFEIIVKVRAQADPAGEAS